MYAEMKLDYSSIVFYTDEEVHYKGEKLKGVAIKSKLLTYCAISKSDFIIDGQIYLRGRVLDKGGKITEEQMLKILSLMELQSSASYKIIPSTYEIFYTDGTVYYNQQRIKGIIVNSEVLIPGDGSVGTTINGDLQIFGKVYDTGGKISKSEMICLLDYCDSDPVEACRIITIPNESLDVMYPEISFYTDETIFKNNKKVKGVIYNPEQNIFWEMAGPVCITLDKKIQILDKVYDSGKITAEELYKLVKFADYDDPRQTYELIYY